MRVEPNRTFLIAALIVFACDVAHAQRLTSEVADANNPLAYANALEFPNFFAPSLHGVPSDAGSNTNALFLRGVVAAGRQVIRASLPVSTVPTTGAPFYQSGLGDLSVYDAFILKETTSNIFALGPQLAIPTATDPVLGTGKWQLGVTAIDVHPLQSGDLLGALFTWQASIAGDSDRSKTNLATIQPLMAFQAGQGFYVRSSAITQLDFEQKRYLVPVGLGIGRVFRMGDSLANAFFEPQITVFAKGDSQPALQFLVGLNFQWFK